ncbi:MAG: NUDIX domain-containing protein [Spirochaetales bacterium]|nr:NUDIX domain-containing protein [Spirochaetales bacterium]
MSNQKNQSPFKICPQCGFETLQLQHNIHYSCSQCGWDYFHNTAAAAGILLYRTDEILLVQRNHEPEKGKYDVPGGFVNINESAEEAALRECFEEIGFRPESCAFFTSFPNQYLYKSILYYTCDLYFIARVDNPSFQIDPVEIGDVAFFKNSDIDFNTLAFPSTQNLVRLFIDAGINIH